MAFALFGAVLSTVYGVLAWQALHAAEDVVMTRWLQAEAQTVLERQARDPGAPLPDGRFVRGTTDTAALPEGLQQRASSLAEGIHELHGGGDIQWRLLIRNLSDGQRLYLYLDEGEVEVSEGLEVPVWLLILGLSGLVALIGVGLGVVTTGRVVAPLSRLSAAVSAHDPEDPPPHLQPLVSDDELGALAEHLEAAIARVAASARQEQLFGRYTSHELRSSLAVMRGVTELLEEVDDPRIHRPVGRLGRAVQDMAQIIETCLWLARSQGQMPPAEPVELRPLFDDVVALLAPRASPGVELVVEVEGEAVVRAPRLALRMTLMNLVSNALRHTTEGSITLRGNGDGATVSDTGPGIPSEILARITEPHVKGPGGGHGLGLAIVHGLSARLGWHFEVDSAVGRGTTVRIGLDG